MGEAISFAYYERVESIFGIQGSEGLISIDVRTMWTLSQFFLSNWLFGRNIRRRFLF